METPSFDDFMSQADGNDSFLEKALEEIYPKLRSSPNLPDLPYRIGASAISPPSAGNAEYPGPSLHCPHLSDIDLTILDTGSQGEGNNFHSAQTGETLPQPQQDISTGWESSDKDDNNDTDGKKLELKLKLVRLRLEARREVLGLSETIEDLERAEDDKEYLKLLVQEIELKKTLNKKSGVLVSSMVSATLSPPYKPPAPGPGLGSAAETNNLSPSGRELAQRPPNHFRGPLGGPWQANGKPVEFGGRSDASASNETSKGTSATSPTQGTSSAISVDAKVVVPVGQRPNESARKSLTGATMTYQHRTADVLTPTEGNRTQIGPQPTTVRRKSRKRRLSPVDKALMYDCVIDVVVEQGIVRSERAKKSEDDKRRNEEIRSAGGQCMRCKHFKLACSGGNPCVTCQNFLQAQLQRRQRVDPRFSVCARTKLDGMNIFKYGIHISARGSDHLKGYLHDVFEDSAMHWQNHLLNQLNTTFINVIRREWTADTCITKNALVARHSGWHVLIKANIVLEEAKLFESLAEAIAPLKGHFEQLRALASVHAFAVLEEVMRPANLQKANLLKLIKVISFLASLYQQVLIVKEHTSAPNGRGATTECASHYEMLQALDSAMVCLLRCLITRAFPTKPSLVHLLDETDCWRLLNQTFFQEVFAIMEDYSKLPNDGQNGARNHRRLPVQGSVQVFARYEEESMAHPLSDDSGKEMLPSSQPRIMQEYEADITAGHEAAEQAEAVEAKLQHTTQPVNLEIGDVEYVSGQPFMKKRQKFMNFGTKIAVNFRDMMSPKSKRKDVHETMRDITTTKDLRIPWWSPRAMHILPRLPVRSPEQIDLEQAGNCPEEFMAASRSSAKISLDVQNDWDETPLRHLESNARVSSYL